MITPVFRLWRLLFVSSLGLLGIAGRAADDAFDFDVLRFRAKALASKPYEPRKAEVPESLRKLTYDQFRDIQFDREHAVWRKERLPFQLQFFHLGFIFEHPVKIHELQGKHAREIEFSTDFFKYGPTQVGDLPKTLGFAGLRLHYPLNKPEDELGAFLGASYFRLLCEKAVYGLSARGLAIDTAEPTGEEFPVFEEFWVERPLPGTKHINVYALLDSKRVTGAYRFSITPGPATTTQVKAVLYCRENPQVFGVAPLTSMFWHGENTPQEPTDFRPEVHDSDGLLIASGTGEWIWRPLLNPKEVRVAAFAEENPRGFGLLQRDRKFESYEDLEAHYHDRPSAWIEPVGQWGKGTVRLVELPTNDETNDNIVAFWVPERLPAPGEPIELEYKLHWFMDQIRPPAGFAAATRVGATMEKDSSLRRFIVDFDGPYLRGLNNPNGLAPIVTLSAGATLAHEPTVQKNPFNNSWRVAFVVKPDGSGQAVELRCYLKRDPHVLTETWSYLWKP